MYPCLLQAPAAIPPAAGPSVPVASRNVSAPALAPAPPTHHDEAMAKFRAQSQQRQQSVHVLFQNS
jgi:hypothetical protein